MATVEKRRDAFRVVFWYEGKRYQGAVKAKTDNDALQAKIRIERNLQLLQEGRLSYDPLTDDLFTLMLSDGRLNLPVKAGKRVSFGDFLKDYQDNRPPDKDASTIRTEDIHIKHLLRRLGDKTRLSDVPAKLQQYINIRATDAGRSGNTLSQATIKKELGTLSSVWNGWGMACGLVAHPLTLKRLRYPKHDESAPFHTWAEIERKIARGQLTAKEQAELWDALFLTVPEIEQLLAHIKKAKGPFKTGSYPFIHPMFAFCAYTGARRSEMIRSRIEDIDFDTDRVTLREKKKDRSKKFTTRTVPMAPQLRDVLKAWLMVHPGGPYTFCRTANEPITAQMAAHYWRWMLDNSKWKVLKGWHVLRHSFISNLASRGVAERIIMELAGHLNPDTTRRYAHLLPSTVQDAVGQMFGDRPPIAAT
jgi:integrase